MVREERTNFRDQEYSNWHRTIGEGYSMYDIDSLEYRWGRGFVAVIELKKKRDYDGYREISQDQGQVTLELARAIKAPYFRVQYENEMNKIWVARYGDDGSKYDKDNWKYIRTSDNKRAFFNKEEYEEFLKNL